MNARELSIVLTVNCPLRCRHCSVGSQGVVLPRQTSRWDREEIGTLIAKAASKGFAFVNFVGGEPSAERDLLRAAASMAVAHGMKTGLTTAPVWAPTQAAAERFIESVPGLTTAVISLDEYHLEQVPNEHYVHALRACRSGRVRVILNVCYLDEASASKPLEGLGEAIECVDEVIYQPIVPIGNAKVGGSELAYGGGAILVSNDLMSLKRSCTLGKSATVGLRKDVSACCWASAIARSPIHYPTKTLNAVIRALIHIHTAPPMMLMQEKGFIGSLAADEVDEVLGHVRGRKFINECHLCMFLMLKEHRQVWIDHLRRLSDTPPGHTVGPPLREPQPIAAMPPAE